MDPFSTSGLGSDLAEMDHSSANPGCCLRCFCDVHSTKWLCPRYNLHILSFAQKARSVAPEDCCISHAGGFDETKSQNSAQHVECAAFVESSLINVRETWTIGLGKLVAGGRNETSGESGGTYASVCQSRAQSKPSLWGDGATFCLFYFGVGWGCFRISQLGLDLVCGNCQSSTRSLHILAQARLCSDIFS